MEHNISGENEGNYYQTMAEEVEKKTTTPNRRSMQMSIAKTFESQIDLHLEKTTDKFGEDSWRVRALKTLHSWPVQWSFQILLLLDILGLIVTLFLDSEYPTCTYIERDATCTDGIAPECDEDKWHVANIIREVIEIYSPIILIIFLLDNLTLLTILGPKKFFSNCMYTFDLFITIFSLALDISMKILDDTAIFSTLKFVIIGRVWRFISLIHTLLQRSKEDDETEIFNLKARNTQLEEALKENGIAIPAAKKYTENDQELAEKIEMLNA